MNSFYYSVYNENIEVDDTVISKYSQYFDDDVTIVFKGSECNQISNIAYIPTINNSTNINVNTDLSYIGTIVEHNDIDYDASNLNEQLSNKNALQFSSQVIDTYIKKSNNVFNYFTNKIVSIHNSQFKSSGLERLQAIISNIYEDLCHCFIPTDKLPQKINIVCEYNNEYIWRSDESLANQYSLPGIVLKIYFSDKKIISKVEFDYAYNGFAYKENEIKLCNYDENFKHTISRTFSIDQIKSLLNENYLEYIKSCCTISSNKCYYFYFVNLTNEFIHFDNISEYDFYSDAALKQYTLLVYNEALSENKLLSNKEITNEFIRSWKIKNQKHTVNDVKAIVDNIKLYYNKCSDMISHKNK